MTFYSSVLHIHSFLRYVVLLFLIIAILNSLYGIIKKHDFKSTDLKLALFSMISFHIQLLIGIILYFISPKVLFQKSMFHFEMFRFFTIEHILMMAISVVLITIGYLKAKQNIQKKGHSKVLAYYLIALIVVILAIPWPFRTALFSGWL